MQPILIFCPKSYTEVSIFDKIKNDLYDKYKNYYPVFLDPSSCQYNQNAARIEKLKQTVKDQIVCFANFTKILNERQIWWNPYANKWNIYIWQEDNSLAPINELTEQKLYKHSDIKLMYEQGRFERNK